MGKVAFFFNADVVFDATVRALRKRDYKILKLDTENKVIKARFKSGVLRPALLMELKVENVTDTQTNLQILAEAKGGLLTPHNFEANAEQRLVSTLYRLFDRM